jgi:hypothetical protein
LDGLIMARKAKSIDNVEKNTPTPIMDTDENRAKSLQDDKRDNERKADLLSRAKKYFERVEAYESDQRRLEKEDIEFVGLLKQWPDDIRNFRENDPQGARPCLTVDKTNQYKNQIVNQIRQNRPSIKVRPVDDNADIEVAEIYDGIVRHIQDVSRADIAYDWAAECAVDAGLGFFRITTEYCGDSFEQEIKVCKISNRFSCYAPPESQEPDGQDYEEFGIAEMVPRSQFKREYPNADLSDFTVGQSRVDWWNDEHDVRVAEYFYCDYVEDTLLLLDDGNSVFASEFLKDIEETEYPVITQRVLKQRPAKRKVVKWCKLSGSSILEETEIVGQFIPVVPVYGIETVVEGRKYWRGIIRGVKDAQRMYNYNRSTIAEALSLTNRVPYIGAVGQFKTKFKNWMRANVANYAFLEYDPVTIDGVMAPPPQRQGFAGPPTGLLADIETSEHDIQAALGMYQASIGQNTNAKSGRALNSEKVAGDMATFHFPDNLARSMRQAGRIMVGMIPHIYDTQRVVRILGEDGTPNYAQLDPEQDEAMRKTRAMDGTIKKIYNIGVGQYDVTVSIGSSYATKRQEGADFLTQVAQSSPDLMPVIGDVLFKSLDMPYADEIANRLKKMLDPKLQDDASGDSPEVQQIKMQMGQHIEQLTQRLQDAESAMQAAEVEAQELQRKATDNQVKQEVEMLKVSLEERKIQIDEYKAETERLKVEIEAYQNAQNALDKSELDQIKQSVSTVEAAMSHVIDIVNPQEVAE